MDQSAITASHDLEGSLQQLKLQDCSYFLRTGTCAFGSKCRYNHPTAEKLQAVLPNNSAEDLPERPGQIECQFYMKTGICKFGAACWHHHPRPKSAMSGDGQVQLNFLGLPLRLEEIHFLGHIVSKDRVQMDPAKVAAIKNWPPLQNIHDGEKDCAYYLQTGSCKYGSACRFHHPQPTTNESVQSSPNSIMHAPNGVSTPTPVAYQDQGSTWPVSRAHLMPGVPRPLTFMPSVASSPQPVPVARPNSFIQPGQAPLMPTADRGPQVLPRGVNYSHSQGYFTAGTNEGKPTATILHGQTFFPERPGQPDCHHYMKTGDCKFGMNCKYHHPKDRAMSLPSGLNPMGLPLRPGKQSCPYYLKHGICKFGPVCKFDHPLNGVPFSPPYSPSLSSLNEIPVVPFVPESSSVSPGSTASEKLHNSIKGDTVQEFNAKEPGSQISGEKGVAD